MLKRVRTLDLVLSSATHTDAVQTIAEASKGGWIFLLHPLAVHGSHWSADEARKRVVYEPRLRSSVHIWSRYCTYALWLPIHVHISCIGSSSLSSSVIASAPSSIESSTSVRVTNYTPKNVTMSMIVLRRERVLYYLLRSFKFEAVKRDPPSHWPERAREHTAGARPGRQGRASCRPRNGLCVAAVALGE